MCMYRCVHEKVYEETFILVQTRNTFSISKTARKERVSITKKFIILLLTGGGDKYSIRKLVVYFQYLRDIFTLLFLSLNRNKKNKN